MSYLLKAVGADPEFFLKNGKGAPVPAIGLIGGTKEAPHFINKDGFSAIQEDNVMVEFNIAPAKTAKQFAENIRMVMDHLTEKVTKKGLLVAIQPSCEFDMRQLAHPQAMQIGCMGDFNAWSDAPNMPLDAFILGPIRTAGAHIHVSFDHNSTRPKRDSQLAVVRMMDIALGLPSVWMDGDAVRRKFYGKAGAFRPKSYGVEYRTLSNFWIKNKALMEWTFRQVQWSFKKLNDEKFVLEPEDEDRIQTAINKADRGLAQELMVKYDVMIPKELIKNIVTGV